MLIDEWVAYARQLRDGGDGDRLAGGDFDTQFTFAQALTEAAAAVAERGRARVDPGDRTSRSAAIAGKTALEKLKNVVTRKAAQWQPASPDESFEIVRRRLFDPIPDDKARVRDGVIRAFCEMYRTQPGEFPSGTAEAEYRRRMELSYPIHPELFDRLFGDWSTLDKFQRTRGVLRLMALAISQLWQRGDQSLLIMPGNLPMDSGALVSEMKKYLEEGWDPVIKSDVDGENALPLRIDKENKHFGRISATRRAARTVYMGSAARPDGSRGHRHQVGRARLRPAGRAGRPVRRRAQAAVGPGDSPLRRRRAVLVLAAAQRHPGRCRPGRLELHRPRRRRRGQAADRRRSPTAGSFAAMQVFAEGPGDVPDDDDGVRLVVLAPDVDPLAERRPTRRRSRWPSKILAQRDGGPRLNRNLLVFTAAAANRLGELRAATRSYLAWRSIVEDHEALDLTAHQKKQAESKVNETSQQVDSLIAETFTQVLTPSQAARDRRDQVADHRRRPPTGDARCTGRARSSRPRRS